MRSGVLRLSVVDRWEGPVAVGMTRGMARAETRYAVLILLRGFRPWKDESSGGISDGSSERLRP